MDMHDVLAKKEFDIPSFFRHYNAYRIKGNYEYYCQEFAYSAIYGNLKQNNIHRILELLGLSRSPRILYLVRVDDLHNIYKTFPEFRVFPSKVGIVNQLQKTALEGNVSGVISSFVGRDTIGMFLCLDGESILDKSVRSDLADLAERFISDVKRFTGQDISISISEFCNEISRFPKSYAECQEAFCKNFRLGKGSYTFFGEEENNQTLLKEEDMDLFTTQIIFHLIDMDDTGYLKSIENMIGYLRGTNASSADIRLHMVKVVNHIADYYLEFGLEKKAIDLLNLNTMKDILNSNYLSSMESIMQVFCEDILKQLISLHQSSDNKIRAFVEECFKKFYCDSDFNLAKAANICHYSPYHFGRLFKQVFGISFNQYLTNYRIERSKDFLSQSHLSIEEIAWKVGFSSVSYFCTVFKKILGVSPRQYANEGYDIANNSL